MGKHLFPCYIGLDWGGLTREFFELICVNLFDTSNRLFMRFNDENHQALVSEIVPGYSEHLSIV